MNNENFHPIQNEPPLAHALHRWDEKAKKLTYEYNGVDILEILLPESEDAGFRHGSDGTIQSIQYIQQIYLTVEKPMWCTLHFSLCQPAVAMKPRRAAQSEAILGQLGSPLVHGVNGIYDLQQDLLIDFHGCEWYWNEQEIQTKGGRSHASISVLLGEKPLFINLRMQYYRKHLGYNYHKPWEWRPKERPVAGWCSWEAFRRHVTQENIEQVAQFMQQNLLPYGATILQVDDGYQKMPLPYDGKLSMAEGWMTCEEKSFPEGHEGIVRAISEKGLEPGIWTNSNITNPDFPRYHPDDVIWHEGTALKGEWIDYLYTCLPDNLERQVRPLFEAYRKKGYKYVKIDAIRHLLFDGLHEAVRLGEMSNDEAEQRFRAYMEITRQGLGEDVYYLASWGEMHEVVGVTDACRISMDANPTWAGVRMQLFESARWFHSQRVLFLNDPDHVCARTKADWAKTVLSLVSLSGGLYMLSDPMEAYTPEKLSIIQKTLPPLATRTAETGPLDLRYPAYTWTKLHGFAVQSSDKPVKAEEVSIQDAINMAGVYEGMDEKHPFATLWSFHLCNRDIRWCVAARIATKPLPQDSIPLSSLGLHQKNSYHAYDFWAQRYLGTVKGSLPARSLELGHCQIIALHPVQNHPQLIASSRHVSMDAVSVKTESWQAPVYHLAIDGVPKSTQTYTIHCNGKKPKLETAACEGAGLRCGLQEELLVIELEFKKDSAQFSIEFE